jgi:hypothetical protein
MWLSGEFIDGDYDRVWDALRALKQPVYGVKLFASPGGDLVEAMKIGELVRRLRLDTFIAYARSALWPLYLGSDRQAVCASACVFVWFSGIRRWGNSFLVIHRPYYDAAYFSSLSSEEAEAKYAELESTAYAFLRKMDTPERIIRMMRKVSSTDGQVVDQIYVSDELQGTSPAFDEWLTAKCGGKIGSERMLEIFENQKALGGKQYLPEDQARDLKIFECLLPQLEQAVEDAWEKEFGN